MAIVRAFLHLTVWSIFFLDGIIDLLRLAPSTLNRVALLSVGVLFGLTMFKRRVHWPLLPHVVVLAGLAYFSGRVLHDQPAAAVVSFLRQLVLLSYLYFIVIVNEPNERIITFVRRIVTFFVLLQLPASLVKLALAGHTEMYVGTVAMLEGSVTTLISLMPMAVFVGRYLVWRRRSDLALAVAFLLMSQVGGKRATLVYGPIVMGAMYVLYVRMRGLSLLPLARGLVMLLVLAAGTGYVIVRLNPWLNPERAVGGSFDLQYVVDFVNLYNYGVPGERILYEYSRVQAVPYLAAYLWNSGTVPFLFGEGAGRLTRANPEVPPDVEPISHYTGIRYGARPAVLWIYLQIGAVGTVVFTLLLWAMFREVWRHRHRAPAHVLAASGMLGVAVLDIYTYSMVTLQFFSIGGMLVTYVALFYRDRLLHRTHLEAWHPARRVGRSRVVVRLPQEAGA